MTDASCMACVFYRSETSTCHANAPVVLSTVGGVETHWPAVNADDWCGEFGTESAVDEASRN